MKNLIKFPLLLLCVALISCEKERIEVYSQSTTELFGSSTIEYKHSINLMRYFEGNMSIEYKVTGSFHDEFGSLIQDASINVLAEDISQLASFEFSDVFELKDGANLNIRESADGDYVPVTWNVAGSSQSANIYSCAEPLVTFNQDVSSLDHSKNLDINWIVDAENPNDVIYIAFVSRGVPGLSIDENEAYYELQFSEVTEDDGSFTIPSSVFNSWPSGLRVDIIIGRGNQILDSDSETLITEVSYNYHAGLFM